MSIHAKPAGLRCSKKSLFCLKLCAGSFGLIAIALSTSLIILVQHTPANAAEGAAPTIPDFATYELTWVGRQPDLMPPREGAPGARGPIGEHPEHPHYGNNSGFTPTPRIGNDVSPLLLPWAAEQIRVVNDMIFAGGVGFDAAQRCWPPGVTGVLTFGPEPLIVLQAPDQVTFLYQRNQIVRQIYLDRGHSENITPSWHGESVGHYEGDTLVVDTIGFNDRSFLDNFRTPHTELLHVVERYRIVEGSPDLITDRDRPGDEFFTEPGTFVLEVVATVEDPGTFTIPWSTMALYEVVTRPWEESICPENNDDRFGQGLAPLPTATTLDF